MAECFFYNLHNPDQERQSVIWSNSYQIILKNISYQWSVYVDGLSAQKGAGVGILLIELDKKEFLYSIMFMFLITNNVVEGEALLAGLRLVKKIRIEN